MSTQSAQLTPQYYSQIGQDAWVHSQIGNKMNGFFVELGASDGLYLSNTLFFEKSLNWNGICIEPHNGYYDRLQYNRRCYTSNDLIYSKSNIDISFAISDATSSIADENIGPFTEKTNIIYKKTKTLEEILDSFNAPSRIDYLSLDVEGQEYNILSTFPFNKYIFTYITVEHNAPHIGDTQQKLIRTLLESNGYIFVKGNDDICNWGHGPIDDFYMYSL